MCYAFVKQGCKLKELPYREKRSQKERKTERKEGRKEKEREREKKNKSQKGKYRQQMQEDKVGKERVTERKCHKK